MEEGRRPTTGMILGKFMPPHMGHLYCVEFARRFCDRLTVLVCSIGREPIAGELRFAWMRESCPGCDVRHVTEELPQEPADHPEFWRLWREAIRREIPDGPDYVFASEAYGRPLADILGAEFIPIDLGREAVPISATAIRADPLAHWQFIPAAVRPHYLKRVVLFGPESVGKSTLAADLARHFDTVHVPEYARALLDHKAGVPDYADVPLIARGQAAAEDALAPRANKVLICDTDLATTAMWSRYLFGDCPEWIDREADRRPYDLHLLLDVDVPWVDDGQRYLSGQRRAFFEVCRAELVRRGRRFVTVSGGWGERFATAVAAVERVLGERGASAPRV